MVPGKIYKPEDYLEIVWRRKWFAIVPLVLMALGTFLWTQSLPDRYRSQARILIVPQQIPENIVRSTISQPLSQRLNAMTQQIQTRTRLEQIIVDLNLYQEARNTAIMEDVVNRMRRNISVRVQRTRGRRSSPNSFTVSFTSEDPRVAQKVAERLSSLYVTENVQHRATLADQTLQFLTTQLEEARRQLEEHERGLEEFRRTYNGQLPSQVSSNLQVIEGSQRQLQNVVDSMARDRDRLLSIEKMIGDISSGAVSVQADRSASSGAPRGSLAQQIATARTAVQGLEIRLKPDHPDLARAKRQLERLEARAEEEAFNVPVGDGVRSGLAAADQKRISDLQNERATIERRLASNTAQEARLQQVIGTYRARVEAAPTRHNDEIGLMRDYETIKSSYASLRARYERARISADLERRQIGEQFRVLESPRVPQRPFSPNRTRTNTMGAMAGLGFGLALIALLEYRDTSLRTDDDVTLSLALPVLAVIPVMPTVFERTRTKRRRLIAVSASVVLVMAISAAVAAWRFDLIDRLVR